MSSHALSYHDVLSLKETRILILGDVILDCYIEGKVSRISPEAPIPVLLEKNRRFVLGGAGNVAANIATFGAQALLCGRINQNDHDGFQVKELLTSLGISHEQLILCPHSPTISKVRVMTNNSLTSMYQQIVRIDKEVIESLSVDEENKVLKVVDNFIEMPGKKALVLSDYGKGFFSPQLLKNIILKANRAGLPIITDPKSLHVDHYANSTVIKPNLSEARELYQKSFAKQEKMSLRDEVNLLAQFYLDKSQSHNIALSLSEHGVFVLSKNHSSQSKVKSKWLHTRALKVADVSGAGDTLIAFLAMGMASGLDVGDATEIGNFAAGIVCSKAGTATITSAELLNTYHHESDGPLNKLVQVDELQTVVQELKKDNKKIVFTNGCFDLLHAGHVSYLQLAKKQGDVLILGLNSDDSIKRLKGQSRPIQTFEDRACVLSGLACIDFIIGFSDDTPKTLITTIKPDILVKGADYNLTTTVGADDVMGWGGRVEFIPLLQGRSTSKILEKKNEKNL